MKVHPDGTGARKKNGPQAIGKSRGGWTTKIHLGAADACTAVSFAVAPGQAGDAPEGRKVLARTALWAAYVVMDRAYESDETRQCVRALGGHSGRAPQEQPPRSVGV